MQCPARESTEDESGVSSCDKLKLEPAVASQTILHKLVVKLAVEKEKVLPHVAEPSVILNKELILKTGLG